MTVLHNHTKGFNPVLSPSCVAEDSLSGEGFWVCLGRNCYFFGWYGQMEVSDQLNVETSCSVTKSVEPSLVVLRQHTCEAEAAS